MNQCLFLFPVTHKKIQGIQSDNILVEKKDNSVEKKEKKRKGGQYSAFRCPIFVGDGDWPFRGEMTAKFEDWRRLMSPIPFSSSRKKRKQEEEEEEDPDPPSIRDIPLAVIDKQIEILPNYLSPLR